MTFGGAAAEEPERRWRLLLFLSGGWRVAFAALAIGPALGILAMWRLRHRPDATRMANGSR